jgi:membrane associated rhomboid family serine protease
MVFPIYDHNPFKLPVAPVVTWGLIAVNVAVFLIQWAGGAPTDAYIIEHFAAVPSAIARTAPYVGFIPADFTLVTCQFLHENWDHILGNMIFLFVFGDDIEEALGRTRFLIFYLLCGVAASLAFVAVNVNSNQALIGASGAISGVLAAYLLLRPCAKVTVFFLVLVVRVPALVVIGMWAALQAYHLASRDDSSVAYMAHVGGLVAGAILFLVVRPPGVRLLECIWDPEAG